jgi:hypothetical protein
MLTMSYDSNRLSGMTINRRHAAQRGKMARAGQGKVKRVALVDSPTCIVPLTSHPMPEANYLHIDLDE